jgi:ureidoacrylate peracid hydrolase
MVTAIKEHSMNGVTFPPTIIQRVVARRGTEHIFSDLDPARTALVVIDLQYAFMDDEIGHAVCPGARDIVPNVNRLAAALREAGGAVFWIKNTFDEACLTEWSVMQDLATPAMRAKRAGAMSEGTKGHDLWAALDVRPEDEIVKKYRFSAFLPGASELAERLRARGFDTVLITGTVTNVCCESSARDAMMSNFRVVMISDGNAATTQAEHEASLTAFYLTFGDVMDTAIVVDLLGQAAAAAPRRMAAFSQS